jgi:hypothetical protein
MIQILVHEIKKDRKFSNYKIIGPFINLTSKHIYHYVLAIKGKLIYIIDDKIVNVYIGKYQFRLGYKELIFIDFNNGKTNEICIYPEYTNCSHVLLGENRTKFELNKLKY